MIAIGMTALAVVVAALTIMLVARAGLREGIIAAVVVAVLMIAEYTLASTGVLREWTRRPPPFTVAVAVPIVLRW